MNNTFEIDIVPGDFIDTNKEIKSIFTDFVCQEIFSTTSTLYNFMNLISQNFKQLISRANLKYNLKTDDIIFVYKGGNLLRFINHEFMKEIPYRAANILEKFYKNDFKRSDADFSIYVNPTLKNYKEIIEYVTDEAFNLQAGPLREEFNNNMPKYFDYYKYNIQYKQYILTNWLNTKILTMNCLKDPNNVKFYGHKIIGLSLDDATVTTGEYPIKYSYGKDKIINFNQNKTKTVVQQLETGGHIYVQNNKALEFNKGQATVNFNLARSKFNFTLHLLNPQGTIENRNIGGELIDVSIPKDGSLIELYQQLYDNISNYELEYDNNLVIHFQSYSFKYFINDLQRMILEEATVPWLDSKYKKRLNRLLFLYFVEFFINFESLPFRFTYFVKLFNDLSNILQNYSKENYSKHAYDIKGYALKAQLHNMNIWNLLGSIVELYKETPEQDINNFKDFLDTIIKNIDIFNQCMREIIYFTSTNADINENDLYSGNILDSIF